MQNILYVILLNKIQNKKTTQEVIKQHIKHLKKLDQEGRLVLCGPFTDDPSGMVVIKAADKFEANTIAQSDPFVIEGVRSYKIRTWQIANAENNYLG
ncbi:MAG: hypothetical protein IPM57_10195 [Oligoflexia bacterium]|nr:hypothetical protein [Oligoflexia bacterium]